MELADWINVKDMGGVGRKETVNRIYWYLIIFNKTSINTWIIINEYLNIQILSQKNGKLYKGKSSVILV